MKLHSRLSRLWNNEISPFLIKDDKKVYFNQIKSKNSILDKLKKGSVVALIGDYDFESISLLINLIDLKAIIVPLTNATKHQHESFFKIAQVEYILENNILKKRFHKDKNSLIEKLRKRNHSGLIAFSSGTSGQPKAILHDLNLFLRKFLVPRKTYKTLNFLLFDHVGGLNTMFHTLFNKGTIVIPKDRSVPEIVRCCQKYDIELLPTTPSFLRILMLSKLNFSKNFKTLKIISYGTEIMDKFTLKKLCLLLPNVDFRQTYGVSELGVFRVKSLSRDSLFIKIEGDGIKTRINKGMLEIKVKHPMVGYLNSKSPFTKNGWYKTFDTVIENNGYYQITGRNMDIINVSGLKFMASEVETVAMEYPNIVFAKSYAKSNPITGQHCEMMIETRKNSKFDKYDFQYFLNKNLSSHMVPKKITLSKIKIGHRLKKII